MTRLSQHRGAQIPVQESDVSLQYVGAVGEPITVTGTITRKDKVLGRGYSTVSTLLEIDCGTSIVNVFSTARWAVAAKVGEQVTVNGTVKKHQRWRGAPQTLLGWAARVDNQTANTPHDPIRGADGWPACTVTIRRRFPDHPNPATPPDATSAPDANLRRQP